MAALGRLAVAVEADIANFESDMGKAERIARRRAGEIQKALGDAARVVATAMGAAAAAGLVMVQRMARDADTIRKVGQQIGLTTEELSGLRFAASQSGVEFNALTSSMLRLSRTMADAAGGTGASAEAFRAMGIEIRDSTGRLRLQGDVLRDVADRFATYEDGAGKAALAQQLFGRSGAQLIPLLNQGSEGIRELTDQAARLGIVIDSNTAVQAERLNDSIAVIRAAGTGFANQLSQAVIPAFADLAHMLSKSAEQGNLFKEVAEGLATALKVIAAAAIIAVNAIQAVVGTALEAVNFMRSAFQQQTNTIKIAALEATSAWLEATGRMTDETIAFRDAQRRILLEERGAIRESGVEFGSEWRQSISDVTDALEALFPTFERVEKGAKATATAAGSVPPPLLRVVGATDSLAEANREAARAQREFEASLRQAESLYSGLQATFDPISSAIDRYADSLDQLSELESAGAITTERAAQVRIWLNKQYRDSIAAIEGQTTPAEQLLQSLDEELALLRLGNQEREIELALRGATAGMTAEEVSALRAVVAARIAEIDSLREARAAAEEMDRQHQSLVSTISDSLAEALVNGSRGFQSFARQMVDLAKRMVAQMISEFFRLRVIGPILSSLFGGQTAFAAQIPGFGMAPGGAQGAGLSPAMGAGLAGIGGAIYGYRNAGSGGASSLLAAGAYGGLAWTGATIGYGALLGGAAGAATGVAGATASGAASGALGAAGAIPVIGWIAAIAALVDMISGGKLFGTRYRPESSSYGLQIGAAGGEANASVTEVRNRSLFRGRQWRTSSVDPGDEARAAANEFFSSVRGAMIGAAEAMGVELIPVINASIRTVTEYDKKGRETSSKILVDVIGRTWEEASGELAATRVTAEAIIAQVASVFGEATAIAERWRGDAESLLEGAQMLVAISADIKRGAGLLGDGSLGDVVNILDELARGGESLLDTYSRLKTATDALKNALYIAGFDIQNTAEEVVRFAAALADAAGSADEAARLWGRYVDAFIDPVERAAIAYARAGDRAAEALKSIGLDPDVTAQQFRAAFEEALEAGLDPAAMVEWLRAGEALADFLDAGAPLQQLLAGIRAELSELGAVDYSAIAASIVANTESQIRMAVALGASEEELALIRAYGVSQLQALAEAQKEAAVEYARFIEDIILATDGIDPTGYRTAMFEIERATADAIRDANRLAQAAGLQGASERELAAIHRWAAGQARRAMETLREGVMSLMQRLGYGRLNDIERQIEGMQTASAEAGSAMTSAFEGAARAGEDTAARWLSAVQRVSDWLNSILLSDLSVLTPEQRLAEAQAQFDALVALALGGDADAAAALPAAATALLQEARGFYSSTDQYQSIFESTMAAMAQIAAMAAPSISQPGGSGIDDAVIEVINPELQALLEERDAILAQQEAANRLVLAQQLVEHLSMLAEALGVPILTLAADLGISMERLATDLGIDLTEANLEVVQQLASMAAMLGIDLLALAEEVGVSLGDLADAQSLLNQALAAQIESLPAEHADELRPLLRAIEEASTPEEQVAAIEALEAATLGLPDEYRNALAPYLAGVDPALQDIRSELVAIDELINVAIDQIEAIDAVAAEVRALTLAIVEPAERTASAIEQTVGPIQAGSVGIEAIRDMMREQNVSDGLASYANGTDFVPRTGLYTLHRGEAVIPAREAAHFRDSASEPNSNRSVSDSLLEMVISRLERIENAVIVSGDKTAAAATANSAEPSAFRAPYTNQAWR